MEEAPKDKRPAARPSKPTKQQLAEQAALEELQAVEARDREREANKSPFWRAVGELPGWTIWPFGFVALVLIVLVINLAGGLEPSDRPGGSYEAKRSCEASVRSQLRAPSTASIKTLETFQGNVNKENWKFIGEVTAENAFGAMITSRWTCTFENGASIASID